MIITRTPFRLSFFGGGTDYRPWYENQGGIIIASAMARYCYLNIRLLPPFFEHKTRVAYSKFEVVSSNQDIEHPSIRNCLKFMNIEDGLEIHHDGDLPARSGIGSSSSFTVCLLHALHALRYEMVTPKTLADEAAYGCLQVINMGPGAHYMVQPLIVSPEYLHALEQHVLLGFSGIRRNSNQYAEAQIKNIINGESHRNLEEIQSLATEALSLFQKQVNLEEIGKLLDQSWQMKRSLAQGISNSFIDELYTTAKTAGVWGGKLMGAGGSGFVMFLAPPDRHETIKKALKHIKVWAPYKIDKARSQVILHNDL